MLHFASLYAVEVQSTLTGCQEAEESERCVDEKTY